MSYLIFKMQLAKLDNLALYLNTHENIGELPTIEQWVVSNFDNNRFWHLMVTILDHVVNVNLFSPQNIAKAGIARGFEGSDRPEHYNYGNMDILSLVYKTL